MSMLLTYMLTLQSTLTWMLKCFMFIQSTMVNADRCLKMIDVPQERVLPSNAPELLKGRKDWPENGIIEFQEEQLNVEQFR